MSVGASLVAQMVKTIPWRREWLHTPVSLPGEFHEQRSLAGCRHNWANNTFTFFHFQCQYVCIYIYTLIYYRYTYTLYISKKRQNLLEFRNWFIVLDSPTTCLINSTES